MKNYEELKKAKENTCKSKVCREVTYNAYVDIQATRVYYDHKIAFGHIKDDKVNFKEGIANYLNSEECKAMSSDVSNKNSNANDKSGDANNNSGDSKQESNSEEGKTSNNSSINKPVTGIFILICLLLLSIF